MSENIDDDLSQQHRQGRLDQDLAHIGSWALESTDRYENRYIPSLGRDFINECRPPRAPMAKDTQRPNDMVAASDQDYNLARWQLESVKDSPWTAAQFASNHVQDKSQ